MMFFVSAKRLQAILDADRKDQGVKRMRDIVAFDSIEQSLRVLTAIDQRVAAKKALTKAARPPHQPRKKK